MKSTAEAAKPDLEQYLAQGAEHVMRDMLRAAARHPRQSTFAVQFAAACQRAGRRRAQLAAQEQIHIPPFLIASITSQCNLHCAGCYARANHACHEGGTDGQMTAAEWGAFFDEASRCGVSFILLAGGEPMLRRNVLAEAARHRDLLFPVFTNGTVLDDAYYDLLQRSPNIVPILSIEGDEQTTDTRRGSGIYAQLQRNMQELDRHGLMYGASVTVTAANAAETVGDDFVGMLSSHGCRAVIYVEYVPADGQSAALAPDDKTRALLDSRVAVLRVQHPETVFLCFPGDERTSGGCLAAGRGFFHINARGGAEPCPFSPYSDISVRDHTLPEVMQSRLFTALRAGGLLAEYHTGGCVLYERSDAVQQILRESAQ